MQLSGFVKLTYLSAKSLLRNRSPERGGTTVRLPLMPVSGKWVTTGVCRRAEGKGLSCFASLRSILEPQTAFSLRQNGEALWTYFLQSQFAEGRSCPREVDAVPSPAPFILRTDSSYSFLWPRPDNKRKHTLSLPRRNSPIHTVLKQELLYVGRPSKDGGIIFSGNGIRKLVSWFVSYWLTFICKYKVMPKE
jgi:hypothetical protein